MNNKVKKILGNNQLSINTKKALEYFGNDQQIYQKFIKMYCDNYRNLDLVLTNHLINKEYKEVINIIHKIKGLAIYTGCELFEEYVIYLYRKYINIDLINYHNFDDEINLLIKFNQRIIYNLEKY